MRVKTVAYGGGALFCLATGSRFRSADRQSNYAASPSPRSPRPPAPSQHALPPAYPLLSLPNELLSLIWYKLWDKHAGDVMQRVQHQHALSMSCKALHDATSPFITKAAVSVDYESHEGPVPAWSETVAIFLKQLATFPATSTITRLHCSYHERDEEEGAVVHPGLLPGFFHAAASRLAAVTSVKLSGQAALGVGDLWGIAHACPALERLTCISVPVIGPAFKPLSLLPSLHTVMLDNVTAPQGADWLSPSLATLSHVTELHSTVNAGQEALPGMLVLEDLLPHLPALQLLRKLTLHVGRRDSDDTSVFRHLARPMGDLTQCTSLDVLCVNDSDGDVQLLRAADISGLSRATALASLTLHGAVLDTDAIRLLAAMPTLAELSARSLEPDCDLSTIPCAWNPQQLLCLPLRGVELHPCWGLAWTLDPTDDGHFADLHRAAQILGRQSAVQRLQLGWDHSTSVTPSHCARALAALAAVPALELRLGQQGWDVSGDLVQQLEDHLPHLQGLLAHTDGPGFTGFAAALVNKLPRLKTLWVLVDGQADVPWHVQCALLTMAVLRKASRLPLRIGMSYAVSTQQLDCLNAAVRAVDGPNTVVFCM